MACAAHCKLQAALTAPSCLNLRPPSTYNINIVTSHLTPHPHMLHHSTPTSHLKPLPSHLDLELTSLILHISTHHSHLTSYLTPHINSQLIPHILHLNSHPTPPNSHLTPHSSPPVRQSCPASFKPLKPQKMASTRLALLLLRLSAFFCSKNDVKIVVKKLDLLS